jgi:hypothetical protein
MKPTCEETSDWWSALFDQVLYFVFVLVWNTFQLLPLGSPGDHKI